MPIQIDMLTLGPLQTNCFLVGNPDTNAAVIIDPAAQADVILKQVEERGFSVKEILATHTHFDHILAAHAVKEALNVPFRLHKNGVEGLQQLASRAGLFGIPIDDPPAEPDGFIEHGDILEIGGMVFETRFTPGHSPDHLIFVLHEHRVAFVGDCVFQGSIGRTDLPGGDPLALKHSIQDHILTLPDDFVLCHGHGPPTTLEQEKASNYVMAQLLQMPD